MKNITGPPTCSTRPNISPKTVGRPDGGQDTISLAPKGKKTDHRKRRQKPGPKRKHPRNRKGWMPNTYGRYPLSSQVTEFLNKTRDYYAPSTQKERIRKFKLVAKMMTDLGAQKNINNWDREDILRWKRHVESRLDGHTQKKYWQFLRELLQYYDNHTLTRMLNKRELRMPKAPSKEIRTLTEETVWHIHNSTSKIDGWEGEIARFVTLVYPYTGLRPSELRTQNYLDVNLVTWTLKVSHPKGEHSYGRKRTVAIPIPIRQIFLEFFEARRHYIESLGESPDIDILIPYQSRNEITYWPDARWRSLKRRIGIVSGVEFSLKDYRSTFCQWAIDRGAELQAVSKVMGHDTTQTTETYYGRIKDSPAIAEINRVFSEQNPSLIHS